MSIWPNDAVDCPTCAVMRACMNYDDLIATCGLPSCHLCSSTYANRHRTLQVVFGPEPGLSLWPDPPSPASVAKVALAVAALLGLAAIL